MKIQIPLTNADKQRKVRDVLLEQYPLSGRTLKWLRFHAQFDLDGRPVKIGDLIGNSDRVLSLVMKSGLAQGINEKFDVVYEDEFLLVVWKPAGIPVHAGNINSKDSLCHWVMDYLEMDQAFPVGRLDQEVRGYMVFGKNHFMAALLEGQKERGLLKKKYKAMTHGKWKQLYGTIDQPIASSDQFNRYEISTKGKPAITHFKVLKNELPFSLVEVKIETGRTHQIRLHMKWAGHPIAGDQYYGLQDGINSCQLCAASLSLVHPIFHEPMVFENPNPFMDELKQETQKDEESDLSTSQTK